MSLTASFNKAKADIADAASRNLAHARPSTGSVLARTSTPKPSSDLKRPYETAFSRTTEAPKSLSAGQAGGEILTNVLTAIKYLKDKETRPVAFDDLIGYLSLPNDLKANIPHIKTALQNNKSVEFVPKSESPNGQDSFKYRPKHPVANADELRAYLARQPMAQGILAKELRDGWPDCNTVIDALEREGSVLVARLKDGSPRAVWTDNPSFHLINPATQLPQKADQDFRDFWAKTKLPASDMEIRSELERAGLTPTSQVKDVRRTEPKKKEKRRLNRKGGKTTNQHMMGILKDYTGWKK